MARHRSRTIKTPIIGVCVGSDWIKKLLRQQESDKIKEMKDANEHAKVVLYFFSAKEVSLRKKTIKGVYFNKRKWAWEKKEFPFPNVIYKRNVLTSEVARQLQKEKVKPLNYLEGFDKWQVYRQLAKDKSFSEYLQPTLIYNKPDDLEKMLQKSGKLYLKACRGRQGKQVMRLIRLPEGGYEYSYFKNEVYTKKVKGLNQLIFDINQFFGKKRFLIQQAIDLIHLDKKIIDLRAEVQRNGKGEVTVVAVPVRLSQKNAPITTHADAYTFDYFFKNIMKYSEAEITALRHRVNEFLLKAYQSIEKVYGVMGEIGIDFGLDQKGQLWFIECNSQSKKVSLFKAYDEQTINQSFINLLEFAKFRYINEI